MDNEDQDNTQRDLTPHELRYIDRAKNDAFEDGGIVRYYQQAVNRNVHEAVLKAIELRMRTDFPRAARQVFGANGGQAEELLTRVLDAVTARFDIAGNGLGNHIKIGGDERGRTSNPCYVYRYLSYRGTRHEYGAQIALIQQDLESELRVMVRYYRVSRNAPKIDEKEWFAIGDLGQAQQKYLDLLDKIGVPRCAQAA